MTVRINQYILFYTIYLMSANQVSKILKFHAIGVSFTARYKVMSRVSGLVDYVYPAARARPLVDGMRRRSSMNGM